MNNIYVETMPKDCLDCPCRNSEFMHCNLIYCDHSIGYFNEDELDYKYVPINQDYEELICPLKPLSDRLAEERKKVVQEIREEFEPKNATKIDPDKISNEARLVDFGWSKCKERLFTKLDQIERGE